MSGRPIVNLALGIVIAAVLVGVGAGIYNAGIAQGIIEAGRVPAGGPVPGGYYGWGFHGFGFFGLIFPILFILLLVGLARAAFRGPRGGWGHGDPSGGRGPWSGGDGWRTERERHLSELHRRLHEEADPGSGPAGPGTGS